MTASRAILVAALALTSCRTLQSSAQQDPLKCERDPKCEKKRTRQNDCATQCSDDVACMDRCEQFQRSSPSAPLGH